MTILLNRKPCSYRVEIAKILPRVGNCNRGCEVSSRSYHEPSDDPRQSHWDRRLLLSHKKKSAPGGFVISSDPGHKVEIARTGPTALQMPSAARPDVVLLDIGLPGIDGFRVAQL